jgi:hypothetical protein
VARPVNRPFGVLRHETDRLAHLELQPGDHLVLLTDGMLERGVAALDLPDRLRHLEGRHPERSPAPGATSSSKSPDRPCRTTPASWASTGTAATATPATRTPAPTRAE